MVCGEDKVPEVWVLAMATGRPPPVSPLTHSLECTSPECTLGDGGARYKNKTPEYPLEFTMQMLQMHREDNHQQPPGCPQSTEKVLGVRILAFYQKKSEKAMPFRVKEEF